MRENYERTCVVSYAMEDTFVAFLRHGDTKQLLRQMRDTGWRVSGCMFVCSTVS